MSHKPVKQALITDEQYREMGAGEMREQCAKIVDLLANESAQQMRLRVGEMSAQEVRTARAFLNLATTAIRRNGDISPPLRARPRPE